MSKQAILKTLHYADIFDYPLKVEEIYKYLVEPLTTDVLKETLSWMSADSELISTDCGFYCLPGREGVVGLRKRREVYSRPKVEKAKRIARVLKFIPWIKLIGVTGALAVGNSDEDDDIDLMIITARGRLWLTRGLVVTFLLLTGRYRRPGKIKDMVCPNLMIGDDALEFPDRDLFTAHEIVQMKPIFERGNTYQKFLQANEWIKYFLPNVETGHAPSLPQQFNHLIDSKNRRLDRTIQQFNFLETLAYKLQLKFMESKKTVEITTPSIIRFHPHDIRQRVLKEYQKRIKA